MKQIFITLLGLILVAVLSAQNLDKMNESDRRAVLLRKAKEAVMEYGPDFYREYGQPEITHRYVSKDDKHSSLELQKQHYGRSYYMVKFFYDQTEESFDWDYSSRVHIWGDTGLAFCIMFGTGLGYGDSLDQPRSEPLEKATWVKQPPRNTQRKREPYIIRDVTEAGDTIIKVIP